MDSIQKRVNREKIVISGEKSLIAEVCGWTRRGTR
jgi:hypothetical protein